MRQFLLILLYTRAVRCTFALSSSYLFQKARPEILNLLNHPLQLQLATGDLSLGAFQRLVLDRKAILEGLMQATTTGGELQASVQAELDRHDKVHQEWLETAKESGKSIVVPDIECFTCGGHHLNIDCPQDQQISSSALALKSLLISNGLVGAAAVLQCHGFCCRALLQAFQNVLERQENTIEFNPACHGWLKSHAEQWSELGELCSAQLLAQQDGDSEGYTVCLSMLYNWIDAEAATTGIRADLNDPTLSALLDELERLEPGYASQRDKHQSFVADLTGVKTGQALQQRALDKAEKAAAYLAAKKNKNAKLDAAQAYLAAKKKKESEGDS